MLTKKKKYIISHLKTYSLTRSSLSTTEGFLQWIAAGLYNGEIHWLSVIL